MVTIFFFPNIALTKSRYKRNWPTLQILAKTDTALLRKRARYILARVISQHAEIAIQSLKTLNMQVIRWNANYAF